MALFARLVRGTMLETLQQDYVRTARAKGLRYRRVVGLHVLRNSLIPVITAAGPLLGFIITGSFVIELIFNIPGIGQYYVTAVNARDYSVVMGLTVLLSVIVIIANLIVDILYGILDPRTRDARGLMAANPTDIREEGLAVEPHARRVRARRSASRTSGRTPGGATSATRARSSPATSSCSSSSTASSGRSSRRTAATRSTSRSPSRTRASRTRSAPTSSGATSSTRTAEGGRVSILIAFGATFAILAIGVVYGSISGFVGGRLDNGLMRFLDALYGLPYLPFAIITLAIIGRTDKWTMMIALSIASWFTTARIVRGQVMTLKENDYVRAAKAVGARWYRILVRHLLPNTLGILIIAIFLELPAVILGEAFLSFIGLGISPPDASWGAMAQEGRGTLSHPSDRDHRPVGCDRVARPLRELHRRRPARRPRPADEGDVGVALLEVDDLRTHFFTREGTVRAVDGISFAVEKGKTLGIVGESGCGKSVTALSIMGLIPKPPAKIVSGSVLFEGRDLTKLSEHELEDVRGREIAMIFQDPMTSLNPTLTIGTQITETIRRHYDVPQKQADKKAVELLEEVRIPRAGERLKDYPHRFSGGMRQRVMIAIALSCDPKLLIADEPTTALDVTVQASVLDLLDDLRHEHDMAMIIITHDMGVVAEAADDIIVMYAGQIVEHASTLDLFDNPEHPYTEALLGALPQLEGEGIRQGRLTAIPGRPPDLIDPPAACRFGPRCPYAGSDSCTEQMPELRELRKGHWVRSAHPASERVRTEVPA